MHYQLLQSAKELRRRLNADIEESRMNGEFDPLEAMPELKGFAEKLAVALMQNLLGACKTPAEIESFIENLKTFEAQHLLTIGEGENTLAIQEWFSSLLKMFRSGKFPESPPPGGTIGKVPLEKVSLNLQIREELREGLREELMTPKPGGTIG